MIGGFSDQNKGDRNRFVYITYTWLHGAWHH